MAKGVANQVRIQRTEVEWRALCDEFERSGVTMGEFSSRHGFSRTALEYWRRQFRSGRRGSASASFSEFELHPKGEALAAGTEYEVKLPGGKSLVVRGGACDPSVVKALIAVLGG